MLGARLTAYPAVAAVKNVDRIFERPVPASGGTAPQRGRPRSWSEVQENSLQITRVLT